MAATEAQIRVVADTSQAERALGNLNGALKGLVAAASLTALSKFTDSIANLKNKLSLVTQEGQSADQAFKIMAKSALNLGAPLKDVGDLFFRVANNTKDLGLVQKDQVAITETLIKGFQLTGQTMGETQGAIIQLGQAFSQGVLRGDELNSVLESLPMVADAIAAKFGVQRGALKALGEQGRITSKDLSDAILASGAAIDKAWANKIPTVEQSFNKLQTALTLAFEQVNNGVGIGEAMSLALLKITVALVKVIKFFEDFGGVIKVVLSLLGAFAAATVVGRALGAIGAGLTIVTRLFSGAGGTMGLFLERVRMLPGALASMSGSMSGLGAVLIWLFNPLGKTIKYFGSLLASVGAFFGIKSLFPKDKQDAINSAADATKELNKLLGLDQVEALNKAKEATKGLTAQQVKDQDAWKKGNQERLESLREIMRAQADSIVLSQYEGDELIQQTAVQQANEKLIKAIKNDKGEIIGYTAGLSAIEESNLRLYVQQNEQLKAQTALKAAISKNEGTAAMGQRAAGIVGGMAPGIEATYAKDMAALKYALEQKAISEAQYKDQSILIEQQRSDALIGIEQKTAEARMRINGVTNQAIIDAVKAQMNNVAMIQKGGMAGAQGILGSMEQVFGALAATNKKAFETHKAIATAQAIISTYQAAAMAIAMPPGPPLSFIYVAGAIAAGMAQVAAIRNQSYSGRALGGPVMGNQSYIVGERGPELFTPNTSGKITRNQDLGGGTTNVNFTIVANDSTGFDNLLNSRKGMIKQLISDAMLDKGQRF